ncbi:MAG TPA: response regulator [Verrucomicrobiales bacterium]|nr:response regulator [Verrucomicrobiales bacterium]
MYDSKIVYLLDDEPGMVKALTRLLRAEGYAVEGFTVPDDFLRAYQPQAVSCLVLDVAMPLIEGLEFHRRLLSMDIEVPVIFLTGHGDLPMSVRAMKQGASDFLTKPVNGADLLAAIRIALSKSAFIRAATRMESPSGAPRAEHEPGRKPSGS